MFALSMSRSDLALLDRALNSGGRIGRPSVPLVTQQTILRMRLNGDTLAHIAHMTGVSAQTVFRYTAGIANKRRHNKHILVHRRTGIAA